MPGIVGRREKEEKCEVRSAWKRVGRGSEGCVGLGTLGSQRRGVGRLAQDTWGEEVCGTTCDAWGRKSKAAPLESARGRARDCVTIATPATNATDDMDHQCSLRRQPTAKALLDGGGRHLLFPVLQGRPGARAIVRSSIYRGHVGGGQHWWPGLATVPNKASRGEQLRLSAAVLKAGHRCLARAARRATHGSHRYWLAAHTSDTGAATRGHAPIWSAANWRPASI